MVVLAYLELHDSHAPVMVTQVLGFFASAGSRGVRTCSLLLVDS
jgi:hypothetical protein